MAAATTDFEFRTVSRLVLAWGGAAKLGGLVEGLTASRRALVVTDAGLHRLGILAPALASLAASGFEVTLFDAVVADPPDHVVLGAAEQARACGAGLVVGIGGGSSLDVAKLCAALAVSDQPLAEMYGTGNVRGARLPLVLVPTTAGTGSEVTDISVVTTGETTKLGVVSPVLFCDMALLDASLTLDLPALHTAASGIDAAVHAIEAYTSRHRKNPISDHLAREALRLLGGNLVTACRHGGNREAREAMLRGAMLAGQAFANAPVAAVHALAYPLGGHFHVPHGLSNALMLGPVLRFNATAATPLYAELADIVAAPDRGGAEARAASFVVAMQLLMDQSGAPRRLREVGVPEDALPLLASEAMKQGRLLVNNPIEVTEADALALYREAF